MLGEEISLTAQVGIVDTGVPDGVWFELFHEGCHIGAFADNALLDQINGPSMLVSGETIAVTGTLVLFAGELELAIFEFHGIGTAAAQTEMPPAETLPTGDHPETAQTEKAEMPASFNVSYGITDYPESRWQDITLTITDDEGNSLANIPVTYNQTDIDFFISAPAISAFGKLEGAEWEIVSSEDGLLNYAATSSNAGEWVDYPDKEIQVERLAQLGHNAQEYYPWWAWVRAEPVDNQWDFQGAPGAPDDAQAIDEGEFSAPEFFKTNYPAQRFNTFWVGPQFNVPDMVPQWIDYMDMEEFKQQFAEFITLAFLQNPSGHFDLYELTVEINDSPVWGKAAWDITDEEWQDAIEFIKWEADLIRSLDPDAKISIDFDPYVYFPDVPAANMKNWIDRIIAAGVDFDVIGMEIHPASMANALNTAQELKSFLNSLDIYGKEIYLWEYGVRSLGVPQINELPTDWQAPVSEYTEEFQEALLLEAFEVLINNPNVIGMRYVVYKDPSDLWDAEYINLRGMGFGLLREDRTPKPAYFALRDYRQNIMVSGSATTDKDGVISFNAIPGIFEISVEGQTEVVHIHHD